MGLFSFVLEVKNKTGSWHGSEAAFRLHAKNPMLPNNYSNELVVSSLSLVVFNKDLRITHHGYGTGNFLHWVGI